MALAGNSLLARAGRIVLSSTLVPRRGLSSKVKRAAAAAFKDDFSHHAEGIARLNNGSFGAIPQPVLEAEAEARLKWRENPDSFYFGGALEKRIVEAEDAAADVMGATRGSVALVENATVATMTVARRWERASKNDGLGSKILCLGPVYKASLFAMRYMFGPENVVVADKVGREWAAGGSITEEEILSELEAALREHQPRYLLLEHLSSQPALLFPVARMVELARSHGCVDEILVDAAHAAGQVRRGVGSGERGECARDGGRSSVKKPGRPS